MKLMSIFALVCTLLCSASLVRGNALGVLFTDSAAANSETQFFTIMNTKWMQNTVQANQITDLGSEGWKQGLRLAGDPDVHFIAWEDIYVNAYHDDILISAEHIVDGNAFNIDMNAVDDVQFVAPRKNTAMSAAHNVQINAGHDSTFSGDRNVNTVTLYDDIVTTSGKLTTVYAGVDIDVTGGDYVLADATNGDISMTADQRDIYMQAYDDVKIWAVKQDVLLQAKLRDINICAQQNIRVLSVLDSSAPDVDEGGIIIITGQLLAPGNLNPVTSPDSGKYNIVIAASDSEGGGVVFSSATQPALEDVPTPTTRDVYFHAARVDQDDTEGIMFFTTQAGVMPVNQDVVSGRISAVAMATNGAVRFGTFNNAADIKGACASNPNLCPNPNSVDFHSAGGGAFSGNTDQTGGAILVSSSGERDPVQVINRNILFHAPVSRLPLYPASSTAYLTNGVGGGIGVEISRVRDSVGPLTEEIYVYSNTELQNNHKMGKVQFSTGLPPYQLKDSVYSPGNVLFQSNGPCASENIVTLMCQNPELATSGITIIAGPMGTDEITGFYPQNDDIIVSAGRSVGEVIVSGGCDVPKSQRRAGDILIHGPTVTGSVQFATGLPLTGTSPDTETTSRDILVTARARTANPANGCAPNPGPHTGVGNVVYATGPVQFPTACDFYDDDGGGNIYYLAGGLNGGISILASDLSSKAAGLGNTPIRGTDPTTKIISANDDSVVIATDNQDGGIVFNSGTTQFTPTAQPGGITFVAPLADSSIYFGTAQIPTGLLNAGLVTLRNDAVLYGVSGGGILIGTDLDTTLEPTDTTIVFAADADTGGISHVVGWTGLPSTPRAQDGSILVNVRGDFGGIGVFTGLLGVAAPSAYVVKPGDVVINARTKLGAPVVSGAIAVVTSDNFGATNGNPIYLSDASGKRAVDYNVYFNAAADQGGIAINFGVNVDAQDRSIIINADDKRQGAISFITGTYNAGTQQQSPVDQNDIAFISQFGGIVLGTGDITSTVAFDYKDIKPNDILINAAAANGGVLISAGTTVPVAQSNSIVVANMALQDYVTSSTSENGGVLFMTGALPPTTLNTEDICFNTRLNTKGGIVVQTGPGSNTAGNPDISTITNGNADKNIVFHAQSSPGSIAFDTLPVPVQVGLNTISVSVPSETGAISIAVLDEFNLPAPVDHSISLTTNNKFGELFIATGTSGLFQAGGPALTSCVIVQGGDDNFLPGPITSDIYVVAGKETRPRNAYQTGSLVFQAQHHDGGVVVAGGPTSPVAYDNSVTLHAPGAINDAAVATSGIFTQVGTTVASNNAILGGFTTVPGGSVVFRTATGNDESGGAAIGKGLGGDILIESSGYNGIVDVRTLQGVDGALVTPVATIRVTSNNVLATTLEGNSAVPFGGDINQIAGGEHFVYADDRLTYSSFAGNLKVSSTLGDVIYQAAKGNVQIGATTYQPNFPGTQYVGAGELGSIYIKSDNTLTPPATPDVIFSAKEFNKVYVDGPLGSHIRLLSFAGTIQFASTIDAPAYPQQTSTNRDVQFFADNDLTVDGIVCTTPTCTAQAAVSFDAITGTKIASQQGGILFASRATSQSNPDHPAAGQISTSAANAVVTQASNGILSFTTKGTYEGSDITFTSNANTNSGIQLYAGAGAPPALVVPNALQVLALHTVQMFSVSGHSVDVFNPTTNASPDGIRVETSSTGGIGISASSTANPTQNLAAGNIQIYADGRFDVQGNILGLTTPFTNLNGVLIETNPLSVGGVATITANLKQSMSFLAEIGGILLESTDSLKTRPGDPQPGSDTPEDGQVQINAQVDITYEGQNILFEVVGNAAFQRESFELGHLQLSGRNGVSIAAGTGGPASKVATSGDVSMLANKDMLVYGLSGVNIDATGGPGKSVANIEITGTTNGVNVGATTNAIAHVANANVLNVVAGNTGSGQGRIDAKAVSGISLTAPTATFDTQATTGSNSIIFASTATPPADPVGKKNVELHADAALTVQSNPSGANGQLEYFSTNGDVSVHTSESKANINTFVNGNTNPATSARTLSLTGGVFDVNGDRGAKALTTSRWLTPLGSRSTLFISTDPNTLTSQGGGSDISFLGGGNVVFNAGTNTNDAVKVQFPFSSNDAVNADYYQLIANAPTQILNTATINTFGKFENVYGYGNLNVGTAAVPVNSHFQGPTIIRGAANVGGSITVTANNADLGLSNWLTDLQGTLTQSDNTATGIVTFGRDVLFENSVNFNANAASLIVKASAVFDPPSKTSAAGGTRFAADVLVEAGYEFEAQHVLTRGASGKVDVLRGDVVLNQGQFRNLIVPNAASANLYPAFYASNGGDFIGGPGHTESGSHFVTAGHGIFGIDPAQNPAGYIPISFTPPLGSTQDFTISAYYVSLQGTLTPDQPYPSIFNNFESTYVGIASSALPGKDAFYARRGGLYAQGAKASLDVGGYYALPQSSHSLAEANCPANPNRGCSPKPLYQLPITAAPPETMQLPPDTTVGVYLNGNGGSNINIGTLQDSINFFGQSIWITARNWASVTSAYRVADNTAVIPANRDNHWTCARSTAQSPIYNHARTVPDSSNYNYLGTCNPALPVTSRSDFLFFDNQPCIVPINVCVNSFWYGNAGNGISTMTQWICTCDASLGIGEFT